MKQKQKEVEIGDVWCNSVGMTYIVVIGFEEEIELGEMIQYAICLRDSSSPDDFIGVQKLPIKTIHKYYDYEGKKKNPFKVLFEVEASK